MSEAPKKGSKTIIKEIRFKHMLCPVCAGELDIPAEALYKPCDFCKKFMHAECQHVIDKTQVMGETMELIMCSTCIGQDDVVE